jgi:hypothetical protein
VAKSDGKRENARPKSRKLNYFFLDGKLEENGPVIPLLHKSLHINRGADKIMTWCYPLGKRVTYTYSDVKKRKAPAFTTTEVGKMLMRHPERIEIGIKQGFIPRPQHTYGLNEHRRMYKYMWSEKDILNAHEYLSSVHRGRPRNDGRITPQRLPTVRELRAMIRQEPLLHVEVSPGEFRPVWKAPDFD